MSNLIILRSFYAFTIMFTQLYEKTIRKQQINRGKQILSK